MVSGNRDSVTLHVYSQTFTLMRYKYIRSIHNPTATKTLIVYRNRLLITVRALIRRLHHTYELQAFQETTG